MPHGFDKLVIDKKSFSTRVIPYFVSFAPALWVLGLGLGRNWTSAFSIYGNGNLLSGIYYIVNRRQKLRVCFSGTGIPKLLFEQEL